LQRWGDDAEANPPRLEQYDAFGHRVDRLLTPEGWRKLFEASAREGLVAIAYERAYGQHSRLYQIAKVRFACEGARRAAAWVSSQRGGLI